VKAVACAPDGQLPDGSKGAEDHSERRTAGLTVGAAKGPGWDDAPVGAWRHARAIALLPGTVTVVVPGAILITADAPDIGWGLDGLVSALPVLAGVALIAAGVALWIWTVRLFARIGKGTLAPWDPTRHLVVEGPYRRVRNPMIAAVLAVLLGEATLFGSPTLLIWFAAFLAIAWAGFLVYEEPSLERRFGEEYREYKRNVPRWLPRHRPWTPAR
jgi:protein-S-isoprenylcysteine O-methyltransferase Ste14